VCVDAADPSIQLTEYAQARHPIWRVIHVEWCR